MPSIEITTMIGCPVMCTYCPQGKLRDAYSGQKYLTLPDFRTILTRIPRHVRIDFSGMSEPWANPDCTKMLIATLAAGYNIAIYTTLYGMDDAEGVCDLLERHAAQIETVCLHLPDASGNMRGWKYSPSWEAAFLRFIAMAGKVPIEAMSMGNTIHPALDHLQITVPGSLMHTRAGNIGAPDGQPIQASVRHAGAVMCSFTPFYDQCVLLPDGSVVLCCMDYSVKHRIGNLLTQEYYEIFEGQGLARLRAENMRQEFSERSLCRTCNRAMAVGTTPQNRLMWRQQA